MEASPRPMRNPGGSGDELQVLIETGRAMVDEQFRVAERLDAKARNQVALAGAFAALVQAVVAQVLSSAGVDPAAVAVLVGLALAAGTAIAVAALATVRAWRLADEKDLPLDRLEAYVDPAAAGDPTVARNIARYYLWLAGERRKSNCERAGKLDTAAWWCGLAVALGAVELGAALVIRLL